MIIDHFYRSILENLPQVVLVATPVSDPETGQTDFLIEYVNPAWERVIGSHIHTVLGKMASKTIYSTTTIPWLLFAQNTLKDGQTQHQTLFSEFLGKWIDITVSGLGPGHLCMHLSDVTDIKQGEIRLKEQNLRLSSISDELASSRNNLKLKLEKIENLNNNLEQLAYYDRLTSLPNRIRFNEILIDEIEIARRSENKIALAIFDIDNLKTINDSLGHESGDEILRQVAQRLRHFEKNDIQSSRYGGDEFLLIIKNYDSDAELLHLVNSIQEILRETYLIFNAELKSTVSIGIAVYPDDANTVQELLKYADIAMTDAKHRGKNTLSLFHSVMQENLLSRINMEKKMILALENEQFKVYYQPQFDVTTKQLRGFEALVRWHDSELGNIGPDTFISIAEETRLIIPLGDWILRTACKSLAEWQHSCGFNGIMSINVSPIQLQQESFIDDLKTVISDYNIPPESLEIEITEGVLIHNFEQSIKLLQEIKDLGIGISLDDFGTGYSSLSYLQFLPLTTLKIDKSFIANITKNKSIEYDITDAIVSLVNKLGLDTIAEGVETDDQLSVIQKIHCKTIQGFLTGRPMPKEECEKCITDGIYSIE